MGISILSLFFNDKSKIKEDLQVLKNNSKVRNQMLNSCLINMIGTLLFFTALKELPVSIVSINEDLVSRLFHLLSYKQLCNKISSIKIHESIKLFENRYIPINNTCFKHHLCNAYFQRASYVGPIVRNFNDYI